MAGLFVNGAGMVTSRVLPTQWVAGLVVIAFGVAVFAVAAAGHSLSGRKRPWPDTLLASAGAGLITTVAFAVAVLVVDPRSPRTVGLRPQRALRRRLTLRSGPCCRRISSSEIPPPFL